MSSFRHLIQFRCRGFGIAPRQVLLHKDETILVYGPQEGFSVVLQKFMVLAPDIVKYFQARGGGMECALFGHAGPGVLPPAVQVFFQKSAQTKP